MIRINIPVSILLLIILKITVSETLFKSNCDQVNSDVWSRKDVSSRIKSWLESIEIVGDKTPFHPIEIKSYHYPKENKTIVDPIAFYDSQSGKRKGWKIASHYKIQQLWHAGYFFGYMDSNNKVSGM